MSKSFIRNSVNKPQDEYFLTEVDNPHQFLSSRLPSGKVVTRPPAANHVLLSNEKYYSFAASQSTSSVFSSALTPLDFRIPMPLSGIARSATLHLNVLNSTGASCTLIPIALLMQRCEIYLNNGNTLVQTIYGTQQFFDYDLLSRECWEGFAAAQNTTVGWGGPSALANNASIDYYLPIHCIFDQCDNFYLGAVQGDIFFRVYLYGTTAQICEAGSAPTLVSADMIIGTHDLPSAHDAELRKEFQSMAHDFPYLNTVNQSYTATFNASTTYNQVLGGVNGLVSHMWFCLRSSLAAAGLRTFTSTLSSFNILDESGQPTPTNMTSITSTLSRYVLTPALMVGDLSVQLPIWMWSHSRNPAIVESTGSTLGSYSYCGKEQLQITTSASHSNGNYTLDVFAKVYQMLILDTNGIFSYVMS